MIIRPMVIEDIDRVYEIECDSFSIPWSKESLRQEVENPLAFYSVAVVEEKIVAYGGLWAVMGEGEITNIAVQKACRKKGIGKELLGDLIERARQNQVFSITLEVRSSNQAAQSLYEAYGFIAIAIRKKYYQKPEEDAVIMQLQIQQ
ncbi:MAG: ribosomal-protein-alanine acetyltransferase [Clostridia bacterium]|jgi:ribosomal-protein-alanine N-acetyltransferase|nr:ribosomal-protein-alanine acetyltransferase [Clostridia bacterium]